MSSSLVKLKCILREQVESLLQYHSLCLVSQILARLVRQGSIHKDTSVPSTFPQSIPHDTFDILEEEPDTQTVQAEIEQLTQQSAKPGTLCLGKRSEGRLLHSFTETCTLIPPHILLPMTRMDMTKDVKRRFHSPYLLQFVFAAQSTIGGNVEMPFRWIVCDQNIRIVGNGI